MSLPIPLPSLFMPLPLPMMIPFMGIQSAVMAKQFGENFQYGKRRISAMSNEEFNALSWEQLMKNNADAVQSLIPTMEKTLQDMRPLVETILREFAQMMKQLIALAPELVQTATGVGGAASAPSQAFQFFPQAFAEESKTKDVTTQIAKELDAYKKSIVNMDLVTVTAQIKLLNSKVPFGWTKFETGTVVELLWVRKNFLIDEIRKSGETKGTLVVPASTETKTPLPAIVETKAFLAKLSKLLGDVQAPEHTLGVLTSKKMTTAPSYKIVLKAYNSKKKLFYNYIQSQRNSNNIQIKIEANKWWKHRFKFYE